MKPLSAASPTVLEHHSASPEATERFAAELSQRLGPGAVVGLDGELGAGKTCFARGFVAALPGGADAYVSSPTFALMNEYPTTPKVVHLDLYRVTGFDDLESTGFWDIVEGGEEIVLVEWCRRVPEVEEILTCLVELRDAGGDERRIRATLR